MNQRTSKKDASEKVELAENFKFALELSVAGTSDPFPGLEPPLPYSGVVIVPGGGGTLSAGVMIGFVVPPVVVPPGVNDPPAALQNEPPKKIIMHQKDHFLRLYLRKCSFMEENLCRKQKFA